MIDRSDRTLVVGAGPGGLVAAAALQARDLPFDIVDAGDRVGGIWDIDRAETPMYESAHFISSRTVSSLPGFPMPEDYPDYPRHDLILKYVQDYARHHDLERHVTFGTRVVEAVPLEADRWRVHLDTGEERLYGALILATGMAWHPRIPEYPGAFGGEARHVFQYGSADELRDKRVLVVGGGNSGADIACDAARAADRAFISLRRGYRFLPKYLFGMPSDVFARRGPPLPSWLEQRFFEFLVDRIVVGPMSRYGLPEPEHRILESHPTLNTQILHYLGHGELEAKPDIRELRDRAVAFADGSEEEIDLILWATGYHRVFPFLADEVQDEKDGVLDLYLNVFHRRLPTLFFLGLFETDGPAYTLFGLQAELIAGWLEERTSSSGSPGRFDVKRATERQDLQGGRRYVASERHAYYVRGEVYEKVLRRVGKGMGWM